MRTTSWIQCLAALIIGLVTVQSVSATTVIGKTRGSFGVSPTGAANYSIPIWSPPGPRGVRPQMAITYDHRGSGGSLGIGWSLSGLSKITRCNRTIAQDGAASPVQLAATDAFCLDGQRLRLTSSDALSTYGQDGTTYQTQLANFSNVIAHGVAGNGPSYFTVQGKDGYTYEYGNVNNSQIITSGSTPVAWALDKITDRYGNTLLSVSYLAQSAQVSGFALPDSISWSPVSAGAGTYNYKMVFTYGNNNAPPSSVSGYVSGTAVLESKLLQSINIQNGPGTTVKLYSLGYDTSSTTGANRLTSVVECSDSAGTNCLRPTAITYQSGTAGTSSSPTSVTASSSSATVYSHYDLNGDGYNDLVFATGTGWYVAFGSASGYGTAQPTGISSSTTVLPGDMLANGRDGLLANNSGTWYYYTWNGTAFSGVSTQLTYETSSIQWALVDIDGDGRPDLIKLTPSPFKVFTRLNTSSGGLPRFSSTLVDAFDATDPSGVILSAAITSGVDATASFGTLLGPLRSVDFNGDGRADLALMLTVHYSFGNFTSFSELLSNGSTFTQNIISSANPGTLPTLSFVNWNSDACTDYIIDGSSTNPTLFVSGCNGTVPSTVNFGAVQFEGAMDWDKDGHMDLLFASDSNPGNLSVYLSTGTGFSGPVATNIPIQDGVGHFYTFFTSDVNGDDLDELEYRNPSTGAIGYYLHNGVGQPPDLVSSITDGYGINFSPQYTSIARGSYSGSANPTNYPEQDTHAPIYVVSSVSQSDGIGGTFTQTYTYTGARRNTQGWGFEGFESVKVTDSRSNSLVSKTTYEQIFPKFGRVSQSDVFQNNGTTLVSHTTYTNQDTVLHSTSYNDRHFIYVQTSTEQGYEVGGPKNGLLITTIGRVNFFDDYGDATLVTSTLTDNDSTSPYVGQSWTTTTNRIITVDPGTNWCLNIPTQVTVTKSATNASSITRTTTFDSSADYIHCRVNTVNVEPSSSAYAVTTSLGYDGFGNINSQTVTGIGMTGRVSTVDWGTTGQFPVTLRDAASNALGASGYKTIKGYDYNLGVQTSEVVQSADGSVANAPPTSWQYDVFGRKVLEQHADGTKIDWVYQDCATIACLVGSHAVVVTSHHYNTDSTVQTDEAVYYDPLDRPLASNRRMLQNGGAYERTDTQYDAFGRVQRRSIPCVWSTPTAMCPYATTYGYDAVGRLVQTQRPINSSNTVPQTSTIQYAGRTVTYTDPQGVASVKINTVAGTLGVSQDPTGYHQTFTYDAFGSLLNVTDSLSNSLFTANYDYGIGAFQRDATDMDLDVSTASGQHRHFNYDALAEITSWSDAKGQSFSQTYDANSRPLIRTEPDLTTNWTWGHTASNHDVGQLTVVSANGYTETYAYDVDARPSNRSITIPSDLTYGYDFAYNNITGLLDTLTYPTSTSGYRLKLSYAYQNGYLQKVSDSNAGTVYWQANAANAWGQVTQETLGSGVVTNRTLDSVTSWPSAVTSGPSGSATLQNESYLFDELGNVTQRQNNNAGLTENFYYDSDYRLDHSNLNGTLNLQMHYDDAGNITSRSDVASGSTWTYHATHKHAVTQTGSGGYGYTYDANGNATSRNGLGITWTSFNHPIQINSSGSGESVQFAYTHTHERWSAVLNSNTGVETTYFIGDLLEKVSAAGGAVDYRHYIFAGGTKVAIYSRTSAGTNTLHYAREDHQGSVATILNSDGTTYVKENFTAFGARRNACTWSGPPTNGQLTKMNAVTRHGYTWQTALGAMGLNDMNGRIQDAITGRFLSADPTISNPSVPQNFNRYSYVLNNPLSYTDPTGFDVEKQWSIDPTSNSPDLIYSVVFSSSTQSLTGIDRDGSQIFHAEHVTIDYAGTISTGDAPNGSADAFGNGAVSFGGAVSGAGGGKNGADKGRASTTPTQQIPCLAGVSCYAEQSRDPDIETVTISACHPPTFSEDMARRSATSAALAGLGAADVSLSTGERLVEHLRPPKGVDLHAIRFLGQGATMLGVGVGVYTAFTAETEEERNLATQDLAFAALAKVWPASAPVASIPYGIGRVYRDIHEAVEASGPSVLDRATGCP